MRDESYDAGYRAGHLQGWLDAMAKVGASGHPAPNSEALHPLPVLPADLPIRVQATAPPMAWAPTTAWPLDQGEETVLAVPGGSGQETVSAPPAQGFRPSAAVRVGERTPPRFPAAPPQLPAASAETPAERQARIEKRDRQNINVTLYVASGSPAGAATSVELLVAWPGGRNRAGDFRL